MEGKGYLAMACGFGGEPTKGLALQGDGAMSRGLLGRGRWALVSSEPHFPLWQAPGKHSGVLKNPVPQKPQGWGQTPSSL